MRIRDLKIELVPVAGLKPCSHNPRTHSKKQIRQIADSISTFGWINPIVIDAKKVVIAGHGRFYAAVLLGMERVPVISIEDLTEAQKRAYILADNKLAESAGWDPDLLATELQDLLKLDLGFEITTTGFEMAEIDLILGDAGGTDTDDLIPELDAESPVVTQPGDLWILGDHQILCGDATKAESYARLMNGERAQMVFADPPYNVRIDGHASGLGRHRHRDFVMASGEMSQEAFTEFLLSAFDLMAAHSISGSIHFVFMDWRHQAEILAAGKAVYSELKNLCVWSKTNAGMGSLYRSAHELVFVFKAGSASHINNVELGRHGRPRTNVWTYPGASSFGADRDAALAMHPTVKPVALVADAILDCSKRNGLILDPFAGSGTIIVAAENTGRRARAIELDPAYVDVAVRRWQVKTGRLAVHAETGESFNDAAARDFDQAVGR